MIKQLIKKLLPLTNSETAAQQEAYWLLQHVTDKSKAQLLVDCNLSSPEEVLLTQLLEKRIHQQMPLAYVLGTVPFGELNLLVRPPILIPRHETEEICEWVVGELILKQVQDDSHKVVQDDSHTAPQSDKRILDIGTGSGCIALYLAQALPHSTVTGIDINPAAIELAVENKIRNKVSNAVFVQGDVFGQNDWIPDQAREDILEKNSPGGDPGPRKDPLFSLIISNPPYVTEDEYTQIDADVARWEDKSALVADDNGLAFYKKITSLAPQYLATGGMLVFEIGTTQDTKVTALMEATGLTDVTVHQDSFGHNRWVVGKRS